MKERNGLSESRSRNSSAEQTRTALVAAGLKLFGRDGFEATSTRDLAAEAGANIASIAYHFGGKEGLRNACAEFIIANLRKVAGAAIMDGSADCSPEEALEKLEFGLSAMVGFLLLRPEARDIATFMLREMSSPSDALERIYGELIRPVHTALCQLWARATDSNPESEETRLAVFALVGQVIYFRIGQPVVMSRMEWKTVGPGEAEKIRSLLVSNLRCLAAARKDNVS